jgi:hypothetical protein
MKIKEPKSMAEIHRIRENIYQETKGMSAKEKSEWIHEEAEKAKKNYQLRLLK